MTKEVLNRHVQGWNEAIDIAVEHVEAQHVVWDMTNIPPRALLDLLAKNLRAFKLSPAALGITQEKK